MGDAGLPLGWMSECPIRGEKDGVGPVGSGVTAAAIARPSSDVIRAGIASAARSEIRATWTEGRRRLQSPSVATQRAS